MRPHQRLTTCSIALMGRKTTSEITEAEVLTKSARRCPLYFYLKGDLSEKKGQIAHLDQDPSNSAEDNLAFLCLEHHSEYDSKTSQHKNFTEKEAKIARTRLYEAIARKEHSPEAIRGHLSSWEIRYPGGLADLSPLPVELSGTTRLAVAENVIVINPSDRAISVRVKLLIQYGITELVLEPAVIPAEPWEVILERFGLRERPSLTFPLPLKAGAFEGHIAFPVPEYGAGRGVGGDVPEQRAYTLKCLKMCCLKQQESSRSPRFMLSMRTTTIEPHLRISRARYRKSFVQHIGAISAFNTLSGTADRKPTTNSSLEISSHSR
jgi:hypothetical protein